MRAMLLFLPLWALFAWLGIELALQPQPVKAIRVIPETTARLPDGLRYCGGIRLETENLDFGSFSALAVRSNGRFIALSDADMVAGGTLHFSDDGYQLQHADIRYFERLPFARLRKWHGDAEAMTRISDDMYAVAFEQWHRIIHLAWKPNGQVRPLARTQQMDIPDSDNLPYNQGIEAMAYDHHTGTYLLLAEEYSTTPPSADGNRLTTLYQGLPGNWRRMAYRLEGGYRPTDMALLPNGDLVILERDFSLRHGFTSRLVTISSADWNAAPHQPLLTPRPIADITEWTFHENMEGLAVLPRDDNTLTLLLISDDNQRLWHYSYIHAFCLDMAALDQLPKRRGADTPKNAILN